LKCADYFVDKFTIVDESGNEIALYDNHLMECCDTMQYVSKASNNAQECHFRQAGKITHPAARIRVFFERGVDKKAV